MRRPLLVCLICVIALLVAPGARAYAIGDYSIDELSTQVEVKTNATAHVTEQQTVTFSNRNAGMVWYLHAPETGESVRIASVRVAPVDDGGTLLGDWTRLQMVDSDPREQGRNPGDTASASLRTTKTQPWFSFNIGDGMMRCYFPTGNAAAKAAGGSDAAEGADTEDFHTYLIETDYDVLHRTRVFRDVGELYWRYAHDSLPADAYNVSLQVVLPAPSGIETPANESIRAWGHGPDAGTFSTGEDGTVTYTVDKVSRGNFAEAHVIFPASWLVDVPANGRNQFSELRGPSTIAEESEWVDIGLRETTWNIMVRMMFLGIALIVMLIGAIAVLRFGRTPRSRRALLRVAATLGIIMLGANLLFRESLTTTMLAAFAALALFISLLLPSEPPSEEV